VTDRQMRLARNVAAVVTVVATVAWAWSWSVAFPGC
jgi:hypothetical protein